MIIIHAHEDHVVAVPYLRVHGELAKATGVPRAMVGRNGDLFMVKPIPGIRRQMVATGRLGWQKQALVRVE